MKTTAYRLTLNTLTCVAAALIASPTVSLIRADDTTVYATGSNNLANVINMGTGTTTTLSQIPGVPTGGNGIDSIAASANGNLYIHTVNGTSSAIYQYNPATNTTTLWNNNFVDNNWFTLAADAAGDVWGINGGKNVYRWGAGGTGPVPLFSVPSGSYRMTVNQPGTIVSLLGTGTVTNYDANTGASLGTLISGLGSELIIPYPYDATRAVLTGGTYDNAGNLWVMNSAKIYEISPTGTLLKTIVPGVGTLSGNPQFDASGDLIFTNLNALGGGAWSTDLYEISAANLANGTNTVTAMALGVGIPAHQLAVIPASTVVPEPGAALLIGAAASLFMVRRRRVA